MAEFDKEQWEQHWSEAGAPDRRDEGGPNPQLVAEVALLAPGTALDAGCGAGAEAIWLATKGWTVTGADISTSALGQAAVRAAEAGIPNEVTWVEADLTTWTPPARFDLVMTAYAHPTTPQLDFYERISGWVAQGGSLLIIGHLHDGHPGEPESGEHEHRHPESASVTVEDITARFAGPSWRVETAREDAREAPTHGGGTVRLRDAVVRLTRLV